MRATYCSACVRACVRVRVCMSVCVHAHARVCVCACACACVCTLTVVLCPYNRVMSSMMYGANQRL